MLRARDQILQDNLQRIRDFTEPSPLMRQLLAQVATFQRNEKLARAMGFAFPGEEHQIQKGSL